MSPSINRYTRRQLPADYDPRGWWSTELQNIQRALDELTARLDASPYLAPPAPSGPGDQKEE